MLQHVVFDGYGANGKADVYLRKAHRYGSCFSTDTYFNLLHRETWRRLTGIERMELRVQARGNGCITVASLSQGPDETTPIWRHQHFPCRAEQTTTFVFPLADWDAAAHFFSWSAAPGDTLTVEQAAYTTPEPPLRPVRVALVVVTFNRKAAVIALVDTYRRACADYPSLGRDTALLLVNNQADVDLSSLADGAAVRLYVNPANEGGAGGFARGAREAMADGGFSHVLFMDDDVMVEPETWLRSLALLRYGKPERAGDLLAGAMFTAERPTHCHVVQEALDERGNRRLLCGDRDAVEQRDVLALTRVPGETMPLAADLFPYAAWWYCVIPLTIFARYGYPLPLFFRGDDQEFGLRTRCRIQHCNGICVWHPAFDNKKNAFRLYCGARNYALTQMLHYKKWRRNGINFFWKHLSRALAANDYASCAAFVLALHDAMHFFTLPRSGNALMQRVSDHVAAFSNMPSSVSPCPRAAALSPAKRATGWWRVAVFCSLGGALLPGGLLRRSGWSAGRFARPYLETPEGMAGYRFSRKKAFFLTAMALWKLCSLPIRNGRKIKRTLETAMWPQTSA